MLKSSILDVHSLAHCSSCFLYRAIVVFTYVIPDQICFIFFFTEILATLRGHSGLVKGLTWDPVGKYIASQADDRSLKVWRTLDWQLETSITKPFDEVTGDNPELGPILASSPCTEEASHAPDYVGECQE